MGKKRTKAPTNTQADSNNVSNQTSSSSEKANGGTKFRNQFWSSNSSSKKNTNGGGHMNNKGTEEQPPKRPESSVSRQFLPKKQQGVSEQWTKQSLENVRLQISPFWDFLVFL
ncbi:unnamed protein product [Anisakis simplex]|uniref:Ovule protein n=1 Tax=Anisakis simplex TaxID=6269 RepID=A0A0M3J7Q3_ANISI|nr:unnamed protein product [Anisakis simplex]